MSTEGVSSPNVSSLRERHDGVSMSLNAVHSSRTSSLTCNGAYRAISLYCAKVRGSGSGSSQSGRSSTVNNEDTPCGLAPTTAAFVPDITIVVTRLAALAAALTGIPPAADRHRSRLTEAVTRGQLRKHTFEPHQRPDRLSPSYQS